MEAGHTAGRWPVNALGSAAGFGSEVVERVSCVGFGPGDWGCPARGGVNGGATPVILPVTAGKPPGLGRKPGRVTPFTPCVAKTERCGGRSGGATRDDLLSVAGGVDGNITGGGPVLVGGAAGLASTGRGSVGVSRIDSAGGSDAAGLDISPSRMGGMCCAPDFFGVAGAAGAGVAVGRPVSELNFGMAVFGGRRT